MFKHSVDIHVTAHPFSIGRSLLDPVLDDHLLLGDALAVGARAERGGCIGAALDEEALDVSRLEADLEVHLGSADHILVVILRGGRRRLVVFDDEARVSAREGDSRQSQAYVESHADQLKIDSRDLKRRFHVHVPAGAVPKDGPSAGITMTTALASLLSGRKVKDTLGMTGEITLQGKVLPNGGVKQKVLAAHRAGLTEVILPARNEVDLDDVPDSCREEMTFRIVDTIDEVLEQALT